MTGRSFGARRRQRRAAALTVATILGGRAFAQSIVDRPELVGFKTGGVVFAPSLTAGLGYDTNVLQEPENSVPPPSPDLVLTLQPAFLLTVPFSNSVFRLGDQLTYVDYSHTTQTNGKTSNDAAADLTLNFGSRDQLQLAAHNVSGVAQTIAFDPGGSLGFQGNAFQLHTEAVSLSRVVQGARGYRLSLERNALRFDPDISANFYNYRGFDGEAAYVEPLSSNMLLSFGYLGSRYDQSYADDPGTVSRTENGDTLYGQIEGQLGPRQPFSVRLGWERLTFAGSGASEGGDFSGVIGDARLAVIVGGGTTFTFRAQRQPYRSYVPSNNYYVFDLIGGWVDRVFVGGSSVGGDIALSMNGYNQPITTTGSGTSYYRQDKVVQLQAYGNLAVSKFVIFRMSLTRNRRYSNAPDADYSNTVLFGGFVLGWI